MDPSMLLAFGQLGTSAVPAVTGIMDRLSTRFSPYLGGARDYYTNQFYNSYQNNPYGDVFSGYGGMFGTGADGSPVLPPEAMAYAMYGQLGNSPFAPSMQGMQQLSMQGAPQVQNAVAPMSNLLGYGDMGFQQPGGQVPAMAPNVAPMTNFQGMGNPNPGNPLNVNIPSQYPSVGVQGPNIMDQAIRGMIENRMNPQQPQAAAPQAPQRPSGQGGGYPQGWGGGPSGGAVGGGAQGRMSAPGPNKGGDVQSMPMAASSAAPAGAQAKPAVPMGQSPQGGTPSPYAGTQSLPQRLFAQGVSMTPEVQQNLMSRASDTLTAGAQSQQRQIRDSLPSGSLRSGQASRMAFDAEQNRVNQIANTRRDIGTQAAMQNFQDLTNTANMQFGMNRDLSNQIMQQNAFNQGVYNNNFGNSMGLLNQMATMGGSEQARQMDIWNRMTGQYMQGVNYPNQYLDRAAQLEMARITPSPMATFPASSFAAPQMQGGGGGGGSDYGWLMPLAGAAGSYMGSR